MRFRYVAAAALSVTLLAGCSATTSGTAQPAHVNPASTPTGSVTTTTAAAAPARVPVTIEGSTGDYLDTLAQNTLSALVTFWDKRGAVTKPMRYTYWESSAGEQSPMCASRHQPEGVFCDRTRGEIDELAWDKTHFGELVNNSEVGAKAASVMLLAHEYGHAVQEAQGNLRDNKHRELQADCLAGVFAADYAPEITDERWGIASNHVYGFTRATADKVRNRIVAFSEGWYKKSAAHCNSYTGS